MSILTIQAKPHPAYSSIPPPGSLGSFSSAPHQEKLMIKHALFARLEAKPGKEADVAAFLQQGLQMANQEATTPIWFALRLGPTTFGVFDAFYDQTGVQNHLTGPIAKALMGPALELLTAPATIERIEVLAMKNAVTA